MFLGWCAERSNMCLCWLKKNQRIQPKEYPVKVNVGCGLCVAKGWINIDGSLNAFLAQWAPLWVLRLFYRYSKSHLFYKEHEYCSIIKTFPFVHHNIKYGIPLHANTVDYLYTSHFLEHLSKTQGYLFLKETYRVLKKGGVLRVVLPDLAYAMALYAHGKKEQALDLFYLGFEGIYDLHRYMYDFPLLKKILEEIGFSQIVQCSYQKGVTPDIQLLDNRPDESFYLEAIK